MGTQPWQKKNMVSQKKGSAEDHVDQLCSGRRKVVRKVARGIGGRTEKERDGTLPEEKQFKHPDTRCWPVKEAKWEGVEGVFHRGVGESISHLVYEPPTQTTIHHCIRRHLGR